ncbi:hypothetical protein SSX86_027761 [Deinandra increscens subsp. villosa]|uniref:Nudix hydrolase domain-containing protein n=1 Tax=Deinandra increscens subsp. villosa TaxID=3103831 RepID=A0AAP0GKM8_9ASTR
MTTVNLRTLGISPARNIHGSLYSVHKLNNLLQQHHVQKSVIRLVVKSMKISEHSLKPAFSPNCPIFLTCNMPTSNLTTQIRASYVKNGEMSHPPAPETGVSVFILKGNKMLFGRRRSVSVGDNTFLLPGGHLEPGESYEECAKREVKEETGLDIKNIELLTSNNNLYYEETHLDVTYVRAYLSDPNQTPQNIEPDKCEGWEWYDLNNLPEPMFGPLSEMFQGGFDPFRIAF